MSNQIGNDYESCRQVLAAEEEPQPNREGIAFSSSDYATDEEAYVALEAFLMKEFGVSDDED